MSLRRFIVLLIFLSYSLIEPVQSTVGNRRRISSSRSEGVIDGHFLLFTETNYVSNIVSFFTVETSEESECKCICKSRRQCLAATYRRSNRLCSLYATDPCDTRSWQSNIDVNFYIHIKRLKYRIFDQPEQNEPLKRLSPTSLCSTTNDRDADRRWLFVLKIAGQAQVPFQGFDFDQAPNRVAPSPWTTTSIETIWNSVLMHQWLILITEISVKAFQRISI